MKKTHTNERPQLNFLQEYEFEKTPILAGLMTTGESIALRPVVENLGLDWSSQLKKIKRDDPKNELWSYSKVIADDGKPRDMVCMNPFNFQNWLHDLNISDNLNIQLWSSYKKGLVIYLMAMLKVSLDEVTRLRHIADEYDILKKMVTDYINANEQGKSFTRQAKEKFKESVELQKDILDRMNKDDSSQLRLL